MTNNAAQENLPSGALFSRPSHAFWRDALQRLLFKDYANIDFCVIMSNA
jgi:hypothetical protein